MRVRAAVSGESVWERVISARTVESLPVLQEAIQAVEALLGLAGEGAHRDPPDSSWGSEAMITRLLERGYQVTGKFKSTGRVRKFVQGITTWSATSSPGARPWLSQAAPHLADYGMVRLISQVWAIPGRLKLLDQQLQRIRLRPTHPRTRDVWRGFHPLLLVHHLEGVLR